MKNIVVKQIFQFMTGIQVSQLDPVTRSAIVSDYLMFNKIVKEFDEEISELTNFVLKGKDKEIIMYREYMSRYQSETNEEMKQQILNLIMSDCGSLLMLDKEIGEHKSAIENREITLDIKKVDRDKFLDSMSAAGINYTMEDILILEPLFL